MAHENQGLRAALIVFVILTIILAVTTFVFFSQYNDAKEKAKQSDQAAQDARNAFNDKDKLLKEFQGMMGFAEGDAPETVRDKFNEDMQKYAPQSLDDSLRVYREVLAQLDKTIKTQNKDLEIEKANRKKLEETVAGLNAQMDAKVAQFKSRADEAEKDQTREAMQFQKDRDRLKKMQEDLAADLDRTKKDEQEQLGQKDSQIAKLTQDVGVMTHAYEQVKGTVDKMRQEVPDKFQGEIVLVNQRSGNVWINRGRDDALRPQTKFSVFPAGLTDVAEVDKKASIEVTRVVNGHLAEARIVNSDPLNPVMVGDKIYTPVWNVGEKRHFALAGIIDLDGDGRSDLERMHTLIEVNGGVVDAPMDAQGARQGQMTLNTRYLVLGEEPAANAPAGLREDYAQMTNKAGELRVETIPLYKFLESMGWVRQVKVARYGGGGLKQFPVEAGGAPSVSSGKVSELFKPRHPPRSTKGSAY